MKQALFQETTLSGVIAVTGNISGLYGIANEKLTGNVEGLTGDVTGLYGDCTCIRGDIDECDLTESDRAYGVDIAELIATPASNLQSLAKSKAAPPAEKETVTPAPAKDDTQSLEWAGTVAVDTPPQT